MKLAATIPFAAVLAASLLSGAGMMAFGPANEAVYPGSQLVEADDSANAVSGDAASSAASDASESSSPDQGLFALGESKVTSASADDARAENLATAVETIDGVVIEPGSTFSFNDAVGDFTGDSRYHLAADEADESARAVPGGGVCQVASALFVAAVRADLDVIERHAHETPRDYVAIGLDAAVDGAHKDLRLRNTSESPITIHASAQGQTVEVSILGHEKPEKTTHDVVASVISEGEGPAPDAPSDEAGRTVTVETSKITFLDGSASAKEVLSSDTYRVNATPYIIDRGSAAPTK